MRATIAPALRRRCRTPGALLTDRLRAHLGRRLEAGDPSPPARALATAWGLVAARAVARPLRLPEGVRVVGVGGAVLGGAGKTPLALALARALPGAALIGHAYRARPERARVVRPDDVVAEVGDDALSAARLLDGDAPVIVAPRRADAVDLAAALGHRFLVVDGLLQTAPRRLHAAVLTLDATAPWGSGACPPAGDLRAPRRALLAAADHLAVLLPPGADLDPDLLALGAIPIPSRATLADGRALGSLAGLRLGLVVTVARPARLLATLASAGLAPAVTLALADHAVPGPRVLRDAARARVDAWLTTARCSTKLPAHLGGAPVLALSHRLEVGALSSLVAQGTAG